MNRLTAICMIIPLSGLLGGCVSSTTEKVAGLDCPASPNCVSSDEDGSQHIAPFVPVASLGTAWTQIAAWIATQEGVRIVDKSASQLHIEVRTSLFGFVDDVYLSLREAEALIAIRSASRLGYWDLGTNRRRIDTWRQRLIEAKVLAAEPAP